MGAPIEIPRDEAQRRAAEELAKAKYQGTPSWWDELTERLSSWLDGLLDPWIGPQPGTPGVSNVVFVVIIAVVVIGLALIVWKVGLPRWRPRVRDAEVELDPEVGAGDYRSTADRAADEGRWTDAVRERFRALVRELEQRTILDPRPGRTALEAAGVAARQLPEVHDELRASALVFNDVMYGDRIADRSAYENLVAHETTIVDAAGRHRALDEDPIDEGTPEVVEP